MTPPRILLALSLAAGLLTASARADTDQTAARAAQILQKYCWQCHDGKPDQQLPGELPIRDLDALRRRHVIPTDKVKDALLKSELYQLVLCGSMPPGALTKPSEEETAVLGDWIAAGAPDFPRETGDVYVMRQIEKDLADLKGRQPDDVKHQRYVSFNHLRSADAPPPGLWRDALLKTLNHLSWEPQPVRVTVIDPPNNTIFRFDNREVGWNARPFEDPAVPNKRSTDDLYDLLLLEYPYATYPKHFEGETGALAQYVQQAGLLRPVPYVYGDWLVKTATQPPLYQDLLRLPRRLTGKDSLEEKIGAAGPPARAAFFPSKMNGGPELVERRSAGLGAYWRTFDAASADNLKDVVRGPAPDAGGLMLFSLPNGLNGYYIAESVALKNGKRLVRLADEAPQALVKDPKTRDHAAVNGLSCLRCHEAGVEPFADASGPAIDGLGPDEKAALRPLFPGKKAMDDFLRDDAARYEKAVTAVHGGPFDGEPLGPLTAWLRPASPVVPVVLVSSGGGLHGLVPPAGTDLDVPRLPPLDGLTLPDYKPPVADLPAKVTVKSLNYETKQETTTFAPGDKFALEIRNDGDHDIYFELIFAEMDGRMLIHQPRRKLEAGQTYHYPADRPLEPGATPRSFFTMQPPAAVDRYILFASDEEFSPGVLLKSTDPGVGDRVVHPFPDGRKDGGKPLDPSHMIKKTIPIRTTAP